MGLFEELGRQDGRQAPEDVEVVPLNDVAHGGGDDHAPEVLGDLTSHGCPPPLKASGICRAIAVNTPAANCPPPLNIEIIRPNREMRSIGRRVYFRRGRTLQL